MPDRRHGPPWGPAGWGGPPWGRGPGRRVFRRIAGFVLFLVAMGTLAGVLIASTLSALPGRGSWLVVGSTVLVVLGLLLTAGRMLRRTWAPVGDLIEATRKLGDGDTGVRIQSPRPGPLGAVSASFNRMAERLEAEDERRRRFIADIGHELRTPMTVIRGEIEAVLDGVHRPEDLANVIDEVDLMDRLLDDLRLLAMTEAGTLRLETSPTDLAELCQEVLSSFSRRAGAQDVHVDLRESPGMPVVEVDPHRMHQVLSNLVGNALDQMPGGGSITVSVGHVPGHAVIEVADTGPGLAPGDTESVFERFVRAGDSTGSGLGLSISRDLVAAHGGDLSARNGAGGGAVFTIRLPE